MIGLIGTGMLGTAVGLRLLQKGFGVVAQNRTRAKTAELERGGAQIAEHPGQVAERCDIVITCVKDADALREIALGKDGLVRAGRPVTVCDMSTINPLASKGIAAELAKSGITMLDTPVMGGPNVAIKGKLVMMASGDRDSFEKCRNILDATSEKVFYLGKNGTAHSVKLAMNLQIAMLAMALSEGVILTRSMSVDPKVFLEILNSTYFKTGMSQNKAYRMIEDKFEPTFLLRNLKKDLHTINESAEAFGLRLPMSELAEKIYQKAEDGGFGDLDYTGILAYLRESSRHN